MVPVVGIIGWHNSGKTTLITEIIRHLSAENYSIGVIKSTKEENLLPDDPQADTGLYADAGATGVALAAPDQFLLRMPSQPMSPQILARLYFSTMDMVIAEGFKSASDLPKIEVHREGYELLYPQVENVIALVSSSQVADLEHFSPDQCKELAEFIRQYLLG